MMIAATIAGIIPDEVLDVMPEFREAIRETALMVAISVTAALIVGTPIGVMLSLARRGGLINKPWLSESLGWIVNVVRSFPFVILVIAMIPITREVAGTSIGPKAASVPLSIAAIAFYARLVEQNIRDVPRGLAEAAIASGASTTQVVRKVMIPEALPSLIASFTTTVISFIAFSATAGLVGGGGLGDLAIRYGYNRFVEPVMYAAVIVLIVAVQIVQLTGTIAVKIVDKR